MSPVRLRVAICGGGVGGLTLAYALSRYPDLRVDIYEAASSFTEIGAAVGLSWRSQRILASFGLRRAVSALGAHFSDDYAPVFQCRKSDQPEGEFIQTMSVKGGLPTVHRAEFHAALIGNMANAQNVGMHTTRRLVSCTQPVDASSPVVLRFHDWTTAECDVLIGADGLKSTTRVSMMMEMAAAADDAGRSTLANGLRDLVEPKFSGTVVYRCIIPSQKLAALNPEHRALKRPLQYLGKDRHIVAVPISNGRFVNVAAFDVDPDEEGKRLPGPWVSQADPKAVARLYDGWEKEVGDIMKVLQTLEVSRWAVNVVNQLPAFSYRRIALIGDAAHAMSPLQASGAGQAIEDAAILAALLSHPRATARTVSKALDVYTRVRRVAAQLVADVSRENSYNCALYFLDGSSSSLADLGSRMQRCWDICHASNDPSRDAQSATEMFDRLSSGASSGR